MSKQTLADLPFGVNLIGKRIWNTWGTVKGSVFSVGLEKRTVTIKWDNGNWSNAIEQRCFGYFNLVEEEKRPTAPKWSMLLWQFDWKNGINGLFVAPWDAVYEHIGARGIINDISGYLDWEDLRVIPMGPIAMGRTIEALGNSWAGYNPLELLQK